MDLKVHPCLLLATFLVVFLPSAGAHNITILLKQFPNFNTFNSLLSQSSIAGEINRRQTITVLALDDSAAGEISGLPKDTLAHVLSVHVILDYYDGKKIHSLKRRSTLFTTLFQTTGVADNNMGFLNFTRLSDGRLAFGSGIPGSDLVATFVKQVATKPYNISVLQISAAIVPKGISGAPLAPFGSPIVVKPEPLVPAPAPAEADAPADAPEVESPADAPEADAPTEDAPGPAPEGAADDLASAEDEEEDEESSSARRVAGVSVLVAAGVALLFSLLD